MEIYHDPDNAASLVPSSFHLRLVKNLVLFALLATDAPGKG